ncbi:MAG: transposase, partial [Candidatus Hydrogenedentota bacterium]
TTEILPEEVKKTLEQIAPGKEEGIKEGIEKGKINAKLKTARRMKELGAQIDFILKATGLSEEDLKQNNIL